MHSDIGGGYGPLDQSIDNNFARIPLRDMMRESVVSGVRIISYDELSKTQAGLFEQRFKVMDKTSDAYRHYLSACGVLSGTVESQIKRHMQIFYSANGTMHRERIETLGKRQRDASKFKYKYLGAKGMAWEIDKYRAAAKLGKWVRFGSPSARAYVQYIKPADWQISAWDQTATRGAVDFVSQYIHDSKVDFIFNAEPFSYLRPRGIQESNVNVTVEWGYWLSNKVDDGKQAIGQAYELSMRKAGDAADATMDAAIEAAGEARRRAEAIATAAQRKAEEAAQYAQRKAQEAKAAASQAYDSTTKAVNDAALAAQHKAEEAAAFARRQAQAAANAAQQGYGVTASAGRSAAAAAENAAQDAREGAEVIYERGIN